MSSGGAARMGWIAPRRAETGGNAAEPVSVAFFPMHTADDRATGTWCVLPAERGAASGIDGEVYLPSSAGLYHEFYRRKSRGWQLRALVYWYFVVFPRRLVQLVRSRGRQVVFVQRSMFRWSSMPLLEWVTAKVLRRPLIYHMDDGIHLAARPLWSAWRCRLADRVVTGNDLIADFATESGGRVERIEYALDASAYPVREHRSDGPVTIGYIGLYPADHLLPLADALAEVCEATGARLECVGGLGRPDLGVRLEPHLTWQTWDADNETMNLAGFDIGIMPLTDTELHRSKEPLKIKEYMAAGIPIVASPVGHNERVVRDGETGFLATTPEEWRERLTSLVSDTELRRRLGGAGRSLVLERYDLPRLLDELGELFREVAAESSRR